MGNFSFPLKVSKSRKKNRILNSSKKRTKQRKNILRALRIAFSFVFGNNWYFQNLLSRFTDLYKNSTRDFDQYEVEKRWPNQKVIHLKADLLTKIWDLIEADQGGCGSCQAQTNKKSRYGCLARKMAKFIKDAKIK